MAKLVTSSVLSASCVKCRSPWEGWVITPRGEDREYEQSATPMRHHPPQITCSPSTAYYSKTTVDNPRKWPRGDRLKGKQ